MIDTTLHDFQSQMNISISTFDDVEMNLSYSMIVSLCF